MCTRNHTYTHTHSQPHTQQPSSPTAAITGAVAVTVAGQDLSQLAVKSFAKLDMTDAYLQATLDEGDRPLFKLPPGVRPTVSAPEGHIVLAESHDSHNPKHAHARAR